MQGSAADFADGGGGCGRLIDERDWAATPFGARRDWPPGLRVTVGLLLRSPVPMVLLWGADGLMLYNDAYAGFAGTGHPALLGMALRDTARDATPFDDEMITIGLGGGTLSRRDRELWLERDGQPAPIWLDIDCSPVTDETGTPAGVLAIVVESTARVLAERRAVAERQRPAALFEQPPVFVAIVSGPEHRFELANPHVVELAGHRPLLGLPVAAAIPEAVAGGYVAMLDAARASGEARVVRGGRCITPASPDGPAVERFVDFVVQPVPGTAPAPDRIFLAGIEATDRVAAAAAFAESEANYRYAAEFNPQVAWTASPDGQLDRVAERWREWTGHDGTGASWAQAVLPDDLDRSLAAWTHSVATGAPYDVEYRVCMVSGPCRWMHSRAFARRDADGRIVRWYGSTEDIHERKLAEQALRDSEAKFRGLAEAMPGFVWTADAAGRLNYASAQWATYSGGGAAAGLGEDWIAYVHPDDRPGAIAAWHEAVASGGVYEREFRLRRADGVYRCWLARAVPIRDGDGIVSRWVGSAADVDAIVAAREVLVRGREQLEQEVARRTAELRANEARLRAVFATSHQFQGLLELDGTLREVNAISLRAIDARLEDVLGRPFWETPWFDATPGMGEMVRAAVARVGAGEVFAEPVTLELPTGRRSFDLSLRPIRDEAGAVVAILPEAVETTARLQAQAALHQNQKLEAMGQLTGGVAHDFNNLLTPIIGALDLLQRRGVGGASEARLIDGALQAAERARLLVQRLLAFARRQPLRPEPIDVGAVIEGLSELVASTSGPRVRVVVEVAEDLPPALADANQLEMAMLNLAVNARDAMPDGGQLTMAAVRETVAPAGPAALAPGDYVKLTVADTGAGMDATTMARATEPFFSTKGIGKGTGLGLSMVHGLASQLGGALAIDSRPGLGTSVALWLPVARTPVAAVAGAAATSAVPAAGAVLLVDDEDQVRATTGAMLDGLGFEVVEAASAEAALALLGTGRRFDLVVTDHLMPGMTGTDLAQRLASERPGLPVLLISGYTDLAEIPASLPRLAKPFRSADLAAGIAAARRA